MEYLVEDFCQHSSGYQVNNVLMNDGRSARAGRPRCATNKLTLALCEHDPYLSVKMPFTEPVAT